MRFRSPKKTSKFASIERGRCCAKVSTPVPEWNGKKHSISMPFDVTELSRMCLNEFRSRHRRETNAWQGCSDSLHLGKGREHMVDLTGTIYDAQQRQFRQREKPQACLHYCGAEGEAMLISVPG